MMDNKTVKFGYISACIAGDARYTTIVSAHLQRDGSVVVVREESGAFGGMDGPGGATALTVTGKDLVSAPTGAAVARAVKGMFDSVIKNYGAPSKNFVWYPPRQSARGCTASNAQAALDWARQAL